MERRGYKSRSTRQSTKLPHQLTAAVCPHTMLFGIYIFKQVFKCEFHTYVGAELKVVARSMLHRGERTSTFSYLASQLATGILSPLPPSHWHWTGCHEHHPYLMASSHCRHITYFSGFYSKSWWAPKHCTGQPWGLAEFTAFMHQNLNDLLKIKQTTWLSRTKCN